MSSAAPALPWPPQPIGPPAGPRHAAPEATAPGAAALLQGAPFAVVEPGRHAAPDEPGARHPAWAPERASERHSEWHRELYDPDRDGDPLDWLGFTAG